MLNPRKAPRQKRSEATFAAVLEAAARILETRGWGALTTNHVAALAGVSVGSLYQYFPGKEAILAELIRRMRSEMLADFEAAAREIDGHGIDDAVEQLTAASLRHHLRRPALAQALEREEGTLDLDEETLRIKTRMRDIVVGALRERGVDQPERTAFDLIALSGGLAHAAIQAGERDFDALHARLCRAARGYLAAGAG